MLGAYVGQIELFVFLIVVGVLSAELPVVHLAVLSYKVNNSDGFVVVGQDLYLAQPFYFLLKSDVYSGLHTRHNLKALLLVADSGYNESAFLCKVSPDHEQSFLVGGSSDLGTSEHYVRCGNRFAGAGVIHLTDNDCFCGKQSAHAEQQTYYVREAFHLCVAVLIG